MAVRERIDRCAFGPPLAFGPLACGCAFGPLAAHYFWTACCALLLDRSLARSFGLVASAKLYTSRLLAGARLYINKKSFMLRELKY